MRIETCIRGLAYGGRAGSPLTFGPSVNPSPVAKKVTTEPRGAAFSSAFRLPSPFKGELNNPGAASATGIVVTPRDSRL